LIDEYQNLSGAQLDAQISATETAIGGSDDAPAEKPGLFERASDEALTAKLGKIHDKAEALSDASLAAKDVPSVGLIASILPSKKPMSIYMNRPQPGGSSCNRPLSSSRK
jgi:hypothetical protein